MPAADGDAFMFVEFQRTIIGNGHYDPNASRPTRRHGLQHLGSPRWRELAWSAGEDHADIGGAE